MKTCHALTLEAVDARQDVDCIQTENNEGKKIAVVKRAELEDSFFGKEVEVEDCEIKATKKLGQKD